MHSFKNAYATYAYAKMHIAKYKKIYSIFRYLTVKFCYKQSRKIGGKNRILCVFRTFIITCQWNFK